MVAARHPPDSARSRRITLLVCWLGYWLVLVLATHLPVPERMAPKIPGIDKVVHVAAFGLLGLLGVWAWVQPAAARRRRLLLWGVILLIFTVLDEALQPLTARQADLVDWSADVVGCGLGVAVGWWRHLRGR